MLSNKSDRNDYDVASSQAAQDNFDRAAAALEAGLARRQADVNNAMAEYQADGVSDNYASMEASWNSAGEEVKGIIRTLRKSLAENDEIAVSTLKRAASYIPG